jgi:hypothetical protein
MKNKNPIIITLPKCILHVWTAFVILVGILFMENIIEEWKKIPDTNHYASNLGRIKNAAGELLQPWKLNNGYMQIQFKHKGKKFLVHRIIGLLFVENPDHLPIINHEDSDRANNNATNLKWSTQSYNIKHGYEFGNMSKQGEKHHLTPFDESDIRHIRELKKLGVKVGKLATRYGVCYQTISNICNNKVWREVL